MRRGRTRLLAAAVAVVAVVPGAVSSSSAWASAVEATNLPAGSEDAAARAYYLAIEKNTRWVETQWDESKGSYVAADAAYISVLGNAVLLKFGDYDSDLTGVDRETLRDHTLRTIAHYATSNRYNGGSEWGGQIFWDSTYESYFTAAAHVLWDELDEATRAQIDRITIGEADYMASLETQPDPRSGGWTTNGLAGGYIGDTKLEEMGNQTMSLATGLAYFPDDPNAGSWRQWLNTWMSNMTGLPVADENNATVVDGMTVADRNQAQNMWPGYLVENHGPYAPHYHQSAWVYPARDTVHFLLAGQPIPSTLIAQPNGDGMYNTVRTLAVAAGMSAHPMVADRFHLYGRDVLPIAGRHLLDGDPYAARAELILADRLAAYVDYPPSGRLTKFSGEPKYEPEARAELGIAYLLHYWRDRLPGGAVQPVNEASFFADSARATDWGPQVGLTAQQSPDALALAVTKPGYVKFAWLPQHDDWLFDESGQNPFMLPSTGIAVTGRSVQTYSRARDGYDATATVIGTNAGGRAGYAGFTTLPDGSAVYASTGTADNEGAVRLFNLLMPGMPGLDGDRTFYGSGGALTLPAGGDQDGLGDGGRDLVTFPASTVRYVRMQGVRPGNQYGYSLWSMVVRNGATGPDLAQGRPTTASSAYPGFPPVNATDGNPQTRWAVAVEGRSNPASWLSVDLGTPLQVDRVDLQWETAYGAAYRIEGSKDGQTWHDLAAVTPTPPGQPVTGHWLNVDDRAGFVVRGTTNEIRVAPSAVTLAAGPADGSSGLVIEEHVGDAASTARLAAAPAPSGGPATLRASLAGGSLSLFNLATAAVAGGHLTIPQAAAYALFEGEQQVEIGPATTYQVDLPEASARVVAPRFTLSRVDGSPVTALRAEVLDSQRLRLTNLAADRVAQVRVVSTQTGRTLPAALPPGAARTLTFVGGQRTPVRDLATGRTTYPASPLPADATAPALAVDADPSTAWRPGSAGHMVVDLGAEVGVGQVRAAWSPGRVRPWSVSVSDDGLHWTRVASFDGSGAGGDLPVGRPARYLAIDVSGWTSPDAQLAELHVLPAASPHDPARTGSTPPEKATPLLEQR